MVEPRRAIVWHPPLDDFSYGIAVKLQRKLQLRGARRPRQQLAAKLVCHAGCRGGHGSRIPTGIDCTVR